MLYNIRPPENAWSAFQKIEYLTEDVLSGKIGLAEAMLRLPEDFSDCRGEIIELPIKKD